MSTASLCSALFNNHVNVSTSKVKFVFTRNGFMCYVLSDVPIDATTDDLNYYTGTSSPQVLESIRKSLEEN